MSVDRRTRAEVFGPGVPVAAWAYGVSASVPPHVHDFVELALVTAGSVEHRTAAGRESLSPGDVVVLRPGAWHAYRPADATGWAVTNAYLGPELLHGQLAWVLDYPRLARLLLRGGRLRTTLPAPARRRAASWLAQLADEHDRVDTVVKVGLMGCVLVELSRAEQETAPRDEPAPLSGPVREALQVMADDLAHPWTVTGLAHRAGMSTSALYRQFRTQLGSGPVEWLTQSRAEAAAALLVQTDLPVSAVGRRVGWPDPSYASRRFRQAFQTSPSAYRSAHAARRV